MHIYTKNPNQEWRKDTENAISSSVSGVLPIFLGTGLPVVVSDGTCVPGYCKPGWEAEGSHWGCFSPSPCPAHGCEEGKMEGVPDPANLQLPPSLPGGTRGQHRLTQPTAGTGQQPAWPWDQRSMEVAESHLWAPPPRLSLQQLLINPTHPLLLGADQNASFPVPCIVSKVGFHSWQLDKGSAGSCLGSDMDVCWLMSRNRVFWPQRINGGRARLGTIMRMSQADPVMSCAQLSTVSLLTLGGKEQEGPACSII